MCIGKRFEFKADILNGSSLQVVHVGYAADRLDETRKNFSGSWSEWSSPLAFSCFSEAVKK